MEELLKSWEKRYELLKSDYESCVAIKTKNALAGQGAELKSCIEDLKKVINKV